MAARSAPGPHGRPRLREPGQPISRIGSPSHCAATDQLAVERPLACNGALFPRLYELHKIPVCIVGKIRYNFLC